MVYAGSFDPNQMTDVFEDMRRRTSGVFGANFLIPEAFVSDLNEIHEQVETAAKLVKVVEFFYRQPDPSLVDLVHKGGALASWQVGSNEEAIAASEAGCDMIVAQGVEAGGHVRGKGQPSDVVKSGLGFCQSPRASSRWHRQWPSHGRGPGSRSFRGKSWDTLHRGHGGGGSS